MDPVQSYLAALSEIHLTGGAVAETSYYPPLVELLNELGRTLDPKVHCQPHPKNQGAGIPDMGLYSTDQIKAGKRKQARKGSEMAPARGVIEATGVGVSLINTVESDARVGEDHREVVHQAGGHRPRPHWERVARLAW